MNRTVIRLENVSKQFIIRENTAKYGSLRESIVDGIKKLKGGMLRKEKYEKIWALKDISFNVEHGEVLGLIGRNGAGKSTLLKVLSRITKPTKGRAIVSGRVGTLLEVGTGFHPELTGKENIYLSGAILGMRKSEIDGKFHEIVDFAETEKFLDTPIKFYSSGMYVRLAFAVAAFLESEILLIDEVLAVGDSAFQQKCIGKMGDIAKAGRTVLFVSHNMGSIRMLCDRVILLDGGSVIEDGEPNIVVDRYLHTTRSLGIEKGEVHWEDSTEAPGCEEIRLISVRLLNSEGRTGYIFDIEKPINIEVIYRIYKPIRGMRMVFTLSTQEGVLVLASTDHNTRPAISEPGLYKSTAIIKDGLLNRNKYYVQIYAGIPGVRKLITGGNFLSFIAEGSSGHGSNYTESWPGVVAPRLDWLIEKL